MSGVIFINKISKNMLLRGVSNYRGQHTLKIIRNNGVQHLDDLKKYLLEIQNKEETSITIDVCFLFILFIAVIKMVESQEKSAKLQAFLTWFRKKRYFTKN